MHESTMMKGLMNQIMSVAHRHGATRVTSVGVVLGALSNISPEHLREHFREAAAGTMAAGARFDVARADDLTDPHAQEIMITSVEVAH